MRFKCLKKKEKVRGNVAFLWLNYGVRQIIENILNQINKEGILEVTVLAGLAINNIQVLVHFFICFGSKECWLKVQKHFNPTNVGAKNILVIQNFGKKNYLPQSNLGLKDFNVPKKMHAQKNFWSKKILALKKLWSKKFWPEKKMDSKKDLW